MPGWDTLVDLVRTLLVVLSQSLGGSLGGAIVVASITLRLATLPLAIRVARRTAEMRRRLQAIEPQLARLRARHGHDAAELARRTMRLRRRNGVETVPRGTFALLGVQLPIGAALFAALRDGLGVGQRFLWVGDLARPDALVAGIAAILAAGATATSATAGAGRGVGAHAGTIASAALTIFFLWRLASGVGVFYAASSLAGIAQGVVVRRIETRRQPGAPRT